MTLEEAQKQLHRAVVHLERAKEVADHADIPEMKARVLATSVEIHLRAVRMIAAGEVPTVHPDCLVPEMPD